MPTVQAHKNILFIHTHTYTHINCSPKKKKNESFYFLSGTMQSHIPNNMCQNPIGKVINLILLWSKAIAKSLLLHLLDF